MTKRKIFFGLVLIIALGAMWQVVKYIWNFEMFYFYEISGPSAPRFTAGWEEMGLFSMKTETVLSSLDRGESDLFIPEPIRETDDVVDIMFSKPVLISDTIPWTQADYLDIANALRKFVWHDSLDDWNLIDMGFNTSCQDNVRGFRNAKFDFHKTGFDLKEMWILDLWRGVFLYPEQEGGLWGEAEYFHRPKNKWEEIDLNRLIITADDALRIAEENGGKEYRTKIQNKCNISINLSGDGLWSVDYLDFEIYINPYTGEFHK